MSADTMTLKPCPFCGESAGWVTDERGIECGHCAAAGPWRDLREADWNTRFVEDALRTRAEKAEAHLALILQVLDEVVRTCDADAAARRSDALACRSAASAGQPTPADVGYLHLTDAERIRLFENAATRAALEALGLRTVRKIVAATLAKTTKEPTT